MNTKSSCLRFSLTHWTRSVPLRENRQKMHHRRSRKRRKEVWRKFSNNGIRLVTKHGPHRIIKKPVFFFSFNLCTTFHDSFCTSPQTTCMPYFAFHDRIAMEPESQEPGWRMEAHVKQALHWPTFITKHGYETFLDSSRYFLSSVEQGVPYSRYPGRLKRQIDYIKT